MKEYKINNHIEYAKIIDGKIGQIDTGKEVSKVDCLGKVVWIKSVTMPLFDNNDKKIAEIVVQYDITRQKELEKLSTKDELTNLYNRRFFNEVFEKEIKQAQRDKIYLSFMILDIDFFKQYNDSYGHNMGDETLIKVSRTIQEAIRRPRDYAFRLGGEEFGVLLNNSNTNDALIIAEKIRQNIENLNIPHSNSKVSDRITASIGLLTIDFSQESVDKQGFYTMADDALYQAKKDGRNRVVVYKNNEIAFF